MRHTVNVSSFSNKHCVLKLVKDANLGACPPPLQSQIDSEKQVTLQDQNYRY